MDWITAVNCNGWVNNCFRFGTSLEVIIMRRFVGCGPFLPPTSWRDVPRKEAEATLKETDAILMKSHEHDLGLNLELMNHDDTLDELVKMLDIEGVVAADDMQLEQFKKEIKEGTLDPHNALFDLLRVFDDELAPLVKEEEKGKEIHIFKK